MADKTIEIKPIPIKSWPNGIADSPYSGFAEIRGMDVVSRPGVISLTPKLAKTTYSSTSGTFTANASTDVLTGPSLTYPIYGSSYFGIIACTFTTTGGLPGGLSTSTTYWLTTAGTNTTYKVSTSLANANAGTYVDITSTGTGTHTLTTLAPSYFTNFANDGVGGKLYALDSNNRIWQANGLLWYLVGGNTLTSASSNGLNIFKNYLLAFRNSTIDAYGPLNGTPAWTNSGTGTWSPNLKGGGGAHKSVVGQDDILYWGDIDSSGNPFIGSLQQVSGKTFDPTDNTTYTFTAGALGLPQNKAITCLAELGQNLMIGTSGNEIYPWDRYSATFNLPIICQERYIYSMRNVGNRLKIAAGNRGNLYGFDGYLAEPIKIFPKHLLADESGTATIPAMEVLGRKLIFTVQTPQQSGVYSMDLITGSLVMENVISAGYTGTNNAMVIPALYSNGNYYYVSWYDIDSSNTGTDISSNLGTAQYLDGSDYSGGTIAYFATEFMSVGRINIPRNIQYLEFYLDRVLASGHNLVIKYRTQQGASYTTLATISGDGTTQTYRIPAGAISTTNIQFKCEVYGSSSATPFLEEILIY